MKIVNTLINSKKSLAFLPHPLGRFVLQLLREKVMAGQWDDEQSDTTSFGRHDWLSFTSSVPAIYQIYVD